MGSEYVGKIRLTLVSRYQDVWEGWQIFCRAGLKSSQLGNIKECAKSKEIYSPIGLSH